MPQDKQPEHAILNEYAQKNTSHKKPPDYNFEDTTIDGRKQFTAKCKFQGKVTEGSASSKNEAKRISARNMLILLKALPDTSPQKVQKEPVIESSNKLEAFNSADLNVHFDKYLETREKDSYKFRKQFAGDLFTENCVDQTELKDDVKSSQSKTLEKLNKIGIAAVNPTNAVSLFKAIVQEMELCYYAEFLETARNDRYAVVIKLNINLFTTIGIGETPEKAIQEAAKNAVEFLLIFNS